MVTGIHFLLTYMCNQECDHCFVYSSPKSKGTFSLTQMKNIYNEIDKIGSIDWIYFEGGEPFLFYPLMVEGIKLARIRNLQIGIVTNAYWATSVDNAELYLKPLSELGISCLNISQDSFHSYGNENESVNNALSTALKLGIDASTICIEKPTVNTSKVNNGTKGEPIVKGDVKFVGRAVKTLTTNLALRSWQCFTECPYEDLVNPKRLHLDSYGNVHICQGLVIGNIWQIPLSKIIGGYDYKSHPICKTLVEGGPTLLAKKYQVHNKGKFITPCHLCFSIRLSLINRYPRYLAPSQVYGLEEMNS